MNPPADGLGTVVFLEVFDGAVIDVAAPPGDPAAGVTAASMVRCDDGSWLGVRWWPTSLRVGLVPFGLDESNVIEFASAEGERTVCGRRRWRLMRWYWRVIEEDRDHLAVYGPFATAEDAWRG